MKSHHSASLAWLTLVAFFIVSLIGFAALPSLVSAQSLSDIIAPPPQTINVNVVIDYQGGNEWHGTVTLDEGSTASVIDSAGAPHDIASDSALAALAQADADSAAFAISDLAYYPSWSALYVNCIDIAAGSKHACSDWQYSVDGQDPSMGADQTILVDGDTVDFYFGSPASDADTGSQPAAPTPAATGGSGGSGSGFSSGSHSGGGGGGGLLALLPFHVLNAATVASSTTALKPGATSTDATIKLDVSIQDFIKHYLSFFKKLI